MIFSNLVLASKSINSRQELLFLTKPKTPASLLLEASSENRIFMKQMYKKIQAMRAGQIGDITFGAIHKKRRNVLRGGASQILMLQDIRRKNLGKSGSKF